MLEERGILQLAEEQDETGKYKGAGNNVESEEMQYSGVIRTTNTPETVRTQFQKFKKFNPTINKDSFGKLMTDFIKDVSQKHNDIFIVDHISLKGEVD